MFGGFLPSILFASRESICHPSYHVLLASSKGLQAIVCSLSLASRVLGKKYFRKDDLAD